MKKLIFFLFAFLIFFVPLILWPYTSEVFEFNKIVLVYILTVLIAAAWLIRSIIEKKFIFRRTILDIPLLIFFGAQLISTVLSIDFYTSVFGYYSRFNGGLLSTICYLVLYWAFVNNLDIKDTVRLIKVWFASAVLVSIYGVAEHFGIDKNIWVQDVQSRIFSTLGQPNWLAAWVTALIPIAWAFALKSKIRSFNFWMYFALSTLLFWVLLFTKSRSGLLGFGVACIIFWGYEFFKNIKKISSFMFPLLIIGFAFLTVCLVSGTELTPSIGQLLSHKKIVQVVDTGNTALETGGTESGIIRKIVWTGAIQVWLHYPIFGTGTETFGYSYYLYRPVAHNLTSEWNFIYNKAHNEFLNIAANNGTVGLVSYLILIGFSIFVFVQKPQNSKTEKLITVGLLAGYVSLSVSNFFGFSVVPTQLEFFLFPVLAIVLTKNEEEKVKSEKVLISNSQKAFMLLILLALSYSLLIICKYWYADTLYSSGCNYNKASRPDLAIQPLTQAINLEPYQSIYYGEVASSYAELAMAYNQTKESTQAGELSDIAINTIEHAVSIAPANIGLRRTQFGVYIKLSTINEKYLTNARSSLVETIKIAPTDPKLEYNLGIIDANLGDFQKAIGEFQKTIELKSNYTDARIEYAAILVHLKQNDEAKAQLNYILKNIDPGNTTVKQALANIK